MMKRKTPKEVRRPEVGVSFRVYQWERNALRPQLVNGQELRDWKKTTLYEFFNQPGEEGWELANATENHSFIFKRPKP